MQIRMYHCNVLIGRLVSTPRPVSGCSQDHRQQKGQNGSSPVGSSHLASSSATSNQPHVVVHRVFFCLYLESEDISLLLV